MTTIERRPLSWLKPDPNNPRRSADPKELDHLGDDMLARGVLVPLLARPDGTLIDGWRRWLAAQRKGIKELPVLITDRPEKEIPGIRLATVFHKIDLSAYEKCLAVCDLKQSHPEWQNQDLAAYLHVDGSAVTRWLSFTKVIPAWQEALKEGKCGVGDVYAASKLPEAEQLGLLALKLSGASRDQIEQAGRKSRNGNASAVRVAKVRCLLPSGVHVLVSGEGVSLDEAIEALSEAMREMKKAKEQGYTAKTFAAAMKDKATKR